jgi:hypothetical protein
MGIDGAPCSKQCKKLPQAIHACMSHSVIHEPYIVCVTMQYTQPEGKQGGTHPV